jgi:starvation-inducible DNA-binding protein
MTATIDTGLDSEDRTEVSRELTKVLADAYAVYLKTHGYHWNVRGRRWTTSPNASVRWASSRRRAIPPSPT